MFLPDEILSPTSLLGYDPADADSYNQFIENMNEQAHFSIIRKVAILKISYAEAENAIKALTPIAAVQSLKQSANIPADEKHLNIFEAVLKNDNYSIQQKLKLIYILFDKGYSQWSYKFLHAPISTDFIHLKEFRKLMGICYLNHLENLYFSHDYIWDHLVDWKQNANFFFSHLLTTHDSKLCIQFISKWMNKLNNEMDAINVKNDILSKITNTFLHDYQSEVITLTKVRILELQLERITSHKGKKIETEDQKKVNSFISAARFFSLFQTSSKNIQDQIVAKNPNASFALKSKKENLIKKINNKLTQESLSKSFTCS